MANVSFKCLSLAAAVLVAVVGFPLRAPAPAPSPAPSPAVDAFGDDLFLITTSVAPNVILIMDNSDSMNHIEWHPAFDPSDPSSYACADFDNDTVYSYSGVNVRENHCGSGDRDIFTPQTPTLWDGRYLNWYFGLDASVPAEATILDEIDNDVASVEGCTVAGGAGPFAEKYRRTRFEAQKQVLLDLLCVAETKNVRFGAAGFREPADALSQDPNGGFIFADLGRSNPNHAAELEAGIKNLNPISSDGTPLAETLFQVYSFWMSRDAADIPTSDQDGNGTPSKFPPYYYDKFGNWVPASSNLWLEDPMLYTCEKAFVIIVTDGVPTRDDFDVDPASTSQGFSNFADLIGDYHAPTDPGTGLSIDPDDPEIPNDANETGWYLDDIAKFMYENDFRPDLTDDQTIDTYTVGLAADAATNDFLKRTAELGNGTAYQAQNGDQLAFALIAALNDIIEKSASFTAATVPSARTTDGADFYQSYFFPRGKSAFWEGHIRSWQITADGDIYDANDQCALDDPTPGECNSGPFIETAQYFWDAADQVPPPGTDNTAGNRQLYVSNNPTAGAVPPPFDLAGISAADLTIEPFTVAGDPAPNSPLYPVAGSTAITEEGLADEIVAFVRGCFFGTGVTDNTLVGTPAACLARPARLGDIFHSNPVMVRRPGLALTEQSYKDFKAHYGERTRMMYAGTNAGFLEALNAGNWDTSNLVYDEGTGAEVWGFMPWQARANVKNLPIDSATSRTHYVDGDVAAGDVWFYDTSAPNTTTMDGSDWHTVLVGALREGGAHYYALDVTNPDGIANYDASKAPIAYPAYLWEWPEATDPSVDLPFMGETWSRPILTKIRVQIGLDDNSGQGYTRHVAIVTGGYHEESDPNPVEVSGKGAASHDPVNGARGRGVYIIDVQTGAILGQKRYDASANDGTENMIYGVVGAPSVFDLDFDGFADVIYFVDMGGQVFKWVIHPVGDDRANDGTGLRTQPNWPFQLFFAADITGISGTDYYKNLFFPPAGAFVNGQLWLAFGSGERRNLAYAGEAGEDENNRFYVMKDISPYTATAATLDETDLTDITGDEDGAAIAGSGYFFTVADGEKFVTNFEIFAGHVIAATFTPSAPGVDPCTTRGNGKLYIFDITNGEGYFSDGASNPTRGLDIGSGLPTDPKVSVGVGGKNNRVIIEKSGADLESLEEQDIDVTGGLLYWRERS
jgi:hypothetical protein